MAAALKSGPSIGPYNAPFSSVSLTTSSHFAPRQRSRRYGALHLAEKAAKLPKIRSSTPCCNVSRPPRDHDYDDNVSTFRQGCSTTGPCAHCPVRDPALRDVATTAQLQSSKSSRS